MKQWFKLVTVIFLTGCSSPLQTNNNNPPVVVDYTYVISDISEGVLPPPRLEDLKLPQGSEVINRLELQLERLVDYRSYLDRSIRSLEFNLNKDRKNREDIRDSLSGIRFDCSRPLIQQIDLGKKPSATTAIEGLSESQIANAALDYAEKMKQYSHESLNKLSEGAALYAQTCK